MARRALWVRLDGQADGEEQRIDLPVDGFVADLLAAAVGPTTPFEFPREGVRAASLQAVLAATGAVLGNRGTLADVGDDDIVVLRLKSAAAGGGAFAAGTGAGGGRGSGLPTVSGRPVGEAPPPAPSFPSTPPPAPARAEPAHAQPAPRAWPAAAPPPAHPADSPPAEATPEVEQWIQSYSLDSRCSHALRLCSTETRAKVMADPLPEDLSQCNPSAMIMGRIKRHDPSIGLLVQQSLGGIGKTAQSPRQIDRFVAHWRLDEATARALSLIRPDTLEEVTSKSLPDNARNPSAIVMGRIRKLEPEVGLQVKSEVEQGQVPGMPGYRGAGAAVPMIAGSGAWSAPAYHDQSGRPVDLQYDQFGQAVDEYGRNVEFVDPQGRRVDKDGNPVQHRAATPRVTGGWAPAPAGGWASAPAAGGGGSDPAALGAARTSLSAYVARNGLDQRTHDALLMLDAGALAQVLGRGDPADMPDCRNPSALMMSRIRAVAPDVGLSPALSDRGAGRGSMVPQGAAMGYAPLAAPLAAPAYTGGAGYAGVPGGGGGWEAFADANGLDSRTRMALQLVAEQRPASLAIAIAKLPDNARNPCAVVMGRIRSIDPNIGLVARDEPGWGRGQAAAQPY